MLKKSKMGSFMVGSPGEYQFNAVEICGAWNAYG
jgi:hypothetical protein